MQSGYKDYTNHIGLRINHELRRIRYFPIPGLFRFTNILSENLLKPKLTGPCIIRTIHGFKMLVDPVFGKGLESALFHNGTYEQGTLRIMNHILKGGGNFIDIGANIGLMSLHASKILRERGKVLSFEPLSSTFGIFQQNIEINNYENIHAMNMALGSKKGTLDIFENAEMNRGASSLIKPENTESSQKISITSLDEFILKHENFSDVECLKIDVEGWELEVLKGAERLLSGSNAPVCILEYSSYHNTYGGDIEEIYEFLLDINTYRLFRLAKGKERPSKLIEINQIADLPKHDNLFCFLPKHIEMLPGRIFD